MGTATYFSPEQAQGLGVDGRSDVYALGVVLYEMVTGRPPFTADTPVAIAYKHVSETAALPSEIEPRVPRDLEAIIMQAMAKQPQGRYSTAQDFHDDLERFMRGQPVFAPMPQGDAGAQTLAIVPDQTLLIAQSGGPVPPTQVQEQVPGPPDGGGQDELPKRRFVPWAAAAVLLAAALGALIYFGGRSLGYFGAAASLHPPNVVGQNYLKAEQNVRAAGLVPVITKRDFSPLAVKGLVKSQSPLPNTLVTKGDDVNLTVLIGPPPPKQVFLGFFKGDLLSAVKPQLQAEGFKVVVVPQVPSSAAIPQGTILDQSPAGSQKYPFGTQVTLTVARGTQKVTIPTKGVVGQSITSARDTLTALGFSVVLGGSEFSTATPPVPSGDVITTNPPPGTPASQGSQVGLIVSKGPAAIMPLVAQNPPITEARAIKLIKAANLVPMVIDVATPGFQAGFVTSQTPSSGTQLTPDSTVTIFVEQSTSTTTTTSTTSTTTTTTTTPGGPTGVTGPTGPTGTS